MNNKDKKQTGARDSSGQSELMKRFKANPFVFIGTMVILLLVIVSFVVVPAMGSDLGAVNTLNFGSYDGKPIEYVNGNYFARQLEYYDNYAKQTGQNSSPQLFYSVWMNAFNGTVIHLGALSEVRRAGLKVPQSLIDQELKNQPILQVNGQLSAAKLRNMGEAELLTLRTNISEEIAKMMFFDTVFSMKMSNNELEFIKSMASPERSFSYVSFPLSDYPDSEVSKYIQENPEMFTSYSMSRLSVLSGEEEAKSILATIQDGTMSFEEAAAANSSDMYTDKSGSMGIKYKYEMSSEIFSEEDREKVLSMKKGEMSEVMQIGAYWVFFRMNEDPIPANSDSSETMEKARYYVNSFERGKVEDYLFAKAESFAERARAEDFNSAAKAFALESKNFGPVPLNYNNSELYPSMAAFEEGVLQNAGSSELFLHTAFGTAPGAVSSPVVLGDNVLVLKVDEEHSADASSLAMVAGGIDYYNEQYTENRLVNYLLENERLKNKFSDTFFSKVYTEE